MRIAPFNSGYFLTDGKAAKGSDLEGRERAGRRLRRVTENRVGDATPGNGVISKFPGFNYSMTRVCSGNWES